MIIKTIHCISKRSYTHFHCSPFLWYSCSKEPVMSDCFTTIVARINVFQCFSIANIFLKNTHPSSRPLRQEWSSRSRDQPRIDRLQHRRRLVEASERGFYCSSSKTIKNHTLKSIFPSLIKPSTIGIISNIMINYEKGLIDEN